MTPAENALAKIYLDEAQAFNEQLKVLVEDNKMSSARFDVLIEKIKNIKTKEEHQALSKEHRELQRRVEINREVQAKLKLVNESLKKKINGLFGKEIW